MEGLKSLLNIIKIFIKDFSPSYNNIKLFCKYGPKIRQKRGNVELSLAIQRKTFQDSCDEILCHHFNESPLVLPLYIYSKESLRFLFFSVSSQQKMMRGRYHGRIEEDCGKCQLIRKYCCKQMIIINYNSFYHNRRPIRSDFVFL